ncbi:MAG: hydrolase, partial [Bacteroidota bacterium]|nr:hydrolase [Bacteroidota bacterium]
MIYTSKYPKPAVTVDCVIFGYEKSSLKVLLIKRGLEPFKGSWALPGGFIKLDETLDEAAKRELVEETGIANVYLEQLYTFGEVA